LKTRSTPAAAAISPADIRAQAAQLLVQVLNGRSLDAVLMNRDESARERGLLRTLCYGSIRWYWRLLAVLEQLCTQPVNKLDEEVRALALIGLFQLLHTDIAPHAAVAETVEAARKLNLGHATGFLNAILRRCQREAATISATVDQDLATRTAHPRWFVERLLHDWPEHAEAILNANNRHPPFWVRVNRQRISRDEYSSRLSNAGLNAQASLHSPDALLLQQAVDVHALPGFDEGLVSVQDAAAQLAAHLLQPRQGERILDACAAPGGKTCHILELQPALKELIAVDVADKRLRRVQSNLKRLGLNATLMEGDASQPQDWWNGELFDRILLDVPCSATGVIRRHPDIKLLRRPDDIDRLAADQAIMLRQLWPLLKPGGRLLYASCSILKSENAHVIAAFLEQHADAADNTASAAEPYNLRSPDTSGLPGMVIQPGEGEMDGFYYACLDKR
jgi:16S rRNA (cytosine967-C5)-methyltransferase